ncbi:MAG: hypothetical protein E6P95_01505 [Candidatus Moraniibacteriota bacterium]|nr:MAG: hypothetical protein E6P95_01505 [Candidatus Moranbacteria bacterium]
MRMRSFLMVPLVVSFSGCIISLPGGEKPIITEAASSKPVNQTTSCATGSTFQNWTCKAKEKTKALDNLLGGINQTTESLETLVSPPK